MKKTLLIILIVISLISCKSNEDPTDEPKKLTTLAERAGTYDAIYEGNILLNMEMEIKNDGSIYIGGAGSSFNKLDPMSTATSFSVVSANGKTTFTLDFSTDKLTGLTGTYAGGIYNISKK